MIIGEGKFKASINTIETVFRKISIYEEKNIPRKSDYHISTLRKMKYLDTWKHYYSNLLYDFLLKDSSMLCFSLSNNKLSYTYLGCPYNALSYEDFLEDIGFQYEDIGDEYFADYELYLDSCDIFEYPVYIRYDYDDSSYTEGLHPVSHIHIGFGNQIRIGFKHILDPITFFLFILRQVYPSVWLNLIKNINEFPILSSYKSKIDKIHSKFENEKDKHEFYLC